jgi:cyclohexanone monooxygenase
MNLYSPGAGTKCEPAAMLDDIDIPALREKYRHERDRRLRPDGRRQYLEAVGEFADYYEHDPYMLVAPRAPITAEIDVAVLGGGFSGLLTAARLRELGISDVRIIDLAGDFGGVWYWNRYPGIQCDNESYCYVPLLEETGFMPSKRFSDGAEIQEQCRRIGRHFDLYKNAIFHTLVKTLRWDAALKRWRIGTNRGDDIKSRFVIICSGPFSRPKIAGIPGIQTFRGHKFHTARWDYEYTGGSWKNPVLDKLADKRVAIIGTGASAIQIIPYLGRYAGHLHVFQRTPSTVNLRNNLPTDHEWVRGLKPGWQEARQRNYHVGALESFARGQEDMVCDLFTEIARNVQARREALGWPDLTPQQLAEMQVAEDYRVMERLRRHIDAVVADKATAEALKPWYRYMCKRPLSNDQYLETFNRPNVTLVDVASSKGVERMTEKGLVANGTEYEVDCVIFASGFEITTGLKRRLGIEMIEGRGGLSLYDHWCNGYLTFHGLSSHGFPNIFFTGYTQAGVAANVVVMFQQQGNHIAHVVAQTLSRGAATVEPSQEAQDEWVRIIRGQAVDMSRYQQECTPGYYNSEGDKEGGSYLGEPYSPGFYAFDQLLRNWRDMGDMQGMILGM